MDVPVGMPAPYVWALPLELSKAEVSTVALPWLPVWVWTTQVVCVCVGHACQIKRCVCWASMSKLCVLAIWGCTVIFAGAVFACIAFFWSSSNIVISNILLMKPTFLTMVLFQLSKCYPAPPTPRTLGQLCFTFCLSNVYNKYIYFNPVSIMFYCIWDHFFNEKQQLMHTQNSQRCWQMERYV